MKVVLSSEIRVERITVFAEMAWLERKPELGLICRASRDHGNRISIYTVQAVLPGLSETGAKNVQAWCRVLGLCDAHGGLTALGEEVAQHDEAPVPEQGVYDLWLAQHPLIGGRVLAVERLASNRDSRFEAIKDPPFEPELNKMFRSVVDPKERFLVRDLPCNHGRSGCIPKSTSAQCRLRWTLDFSDKRDDWQLEGQIEARASQGKHTLQSIRHEPEHEGLDLSVLANTWGRGPMRTFGTWQAAEQRLDVAFTGLTDAEQDTFRKTLKFAQVEVPGKGTYKNAMLEDVPIGPASADDAQRWAMSRFDRHLTKHPSYRSPSEVRRVFAALVEGTPLERFPPTLPAHGERVGGKLHAERPEVFWSLVAPVDLAPRPIHLNDLAAMRLGAPVSEPAPSNGVRIPYGGQWSMRELVDHLVGRGFTGSEPRKVLLCDRYVYGENNLTSLKLFVRSVRTIAPQASVEVWTEEKDSNLKQIQEITNTLPQTYQKVFKHNPPHDRYLLVLPVYGDGYAWHLSNSPLDARVDSPNKDPESPLRWRDFNGARVSVDGLEPTLRRWFKGGAR